MPWSIQRAFQESRNSTMNCSKIALIWISPRKEVEFRFPKRNFKNTDTQKMSLLSRWTLPKEVWWNFQLWRMRWTPRIWKSLFESTDFSLRCSRASSVPWPMIYAIDRIKQLTVSPPGLTSSLSSYCACSMGSSQVSSRISLVWFENKEPIQPQWRGAR